MNILIEPKQIFQRGKGLLLTPHSVWSEVKDEKKSYQEVLLTYSFPLALVSNLLLLFVMGIVGVETVIGRVTTRFIPTFFFCLGASILTPALVLLLGHVSKFMAERFGNNVMLSESVRLIAYASTPLFLLPIVTLLPLGETLQALGILYAVYLAAYGSGSLLGLSRENQIVFGIGIMLTSILLCLALSLVVAPLIPQPVLP